MLVAPDSVRERREQILRDRSAGKLTAEEAGRQLTEADPQYGPGWLSLGAAKLEARDLDAAEPLLWTALELAPTSPVCYIPLVELYRERGDRSLALRFTALSIWKISFGDEVPGELAAGLLKHVPLGDAANEPATYSVVAENIDEEIAGQPWPERLIPFRLLNDLQRQAEAGLSPELIEEVRAHAAVCAPLFCAALREAYETKLSTLSFEAEGLIMALLGEIGGVELIDDLLYVPGSSPEAAFHSQWAVRWLGQRFSTQAFERLRAVARKPDADVRALVAQQLYFLPKMPGVRQAIMGLLEGFPFSGGDADDAHLLLTVSTLLALEGAPSDSLGVLKRHDRRLSKEGRRWMADAVEADDGFVPDLIDLGIDAVDLAEVCTDLVLMPEEGSEDVFDDEEDYEDDEFDDEEDYDEPPPVVKPGRNDPCWCGSGKKYKKCHLDQDEREAREGGESEDEFYSDAWERLLDFSKAFHRRTDMERAAQMFFDRPVEEIDSDAVGESGFVVWYVLDFRTSADARTAIEEFLRRSGARLPDRMRELIESWRDHRYGLWEVQRIEKGRGADVRDVFGGETFFASDVSTSRQCHIWDCMISRLHWFDGKWLFLGDGLVVPRSMLPRLREQVEAGARESGMTQPEYFRSRSHEWRRLILEAHDDRLENLRLVNFEGDPIEFSSAEYEALDAEAAAEVLTGLPMFDEQTDEEDGPDKRVFGWLAEAEGDEPRRPYGHVEIAGGKLKLECNSRRRLTAGRELIEKHCGPAVRHLRDSFTTLQEAKKAVRDEPEEGPGRIDPAIEREIVLKYLAKHYATWPDHPLPALGGRTPRQAVRTKRGRAQVEELLRDFENSAERERKAGRPAFDFSSLRADLGL